MRIEVDGKILEALEGDITTYDGDAIVNAANNHFWMGGGVAGAIKRKGGTAIEQEAMRQGPKPVGKSVITGAGDLKTKFVIHAAVMGQDLQTDSSKIRSATRSALELADGKGLESIAFPALGTGVGGFPMAEAARIMITEAKSFLNASRKIRRISFILYGSDAFKIFTKEMEAP
jgi:O-acetyl-ADP-ribose deacetylase (regulator of RNase III)